MRNFGSYQLVSEHSILSAQRDNRVAAVEKLLEKKAQHSKPEWKEQLDTIKRRLERRRSRCDELTEKDFEIYLEMKLQWLQQYYVTAKSKAPEKKTREPEEDGWNELDFKVYDRGRGKTENPNSRRRRSREDEFHEKLEEMAEILRSYLSNVAVKSSKPEERRETEELKREKDEIEGSIPWNVIAKPKTEVDERGSDRELLNGQAETEAQREEELPEDSLLQEPNNGMIMAATSPLIDLGEISLSCVTDGCDIEEVDEKRKKNDEEPGERRRDGKEHPLETSEHAVTVAEMVRTLRDGQEERSRVAESCERLEEAKEIWAEGFPTKVDSVSISLGQAQVTVSKSAQTLLFTPTQFIINEEVLQVKRELDHVAISLGQTHNFIITPPIFTNSGGMLQEKTEMGQKKEGISFNSRAGGLDKTMDPPNTPLVAENKAFDPGDSFSAFGIARSSCFKLWDPGGRLLLIVSSYIFTLRTR